MRDDKDHNERLDDFSGYMRQRLEEHRLPVDAGGCGRHAPRGRIEDGYSGRWLYHDKLRTGCFTLVSGNASLLHIRTLRRLGRTQTCTGYPTSQAVAKSRLTPG